MGGEPGDAETTVGCADGEVSFLEDREYTV